jgi:uncharacterized membrane protein
VSQSSGTNLEPNVAGLLCYVLGWITGLVFFLIEKDDDFVRFHAVQSMIVFGFFSVLWVFGWIFWFVPVLSWIIWAVLWIGSLICWVLLMIKAYQGERFKLPVAGNLAEKYS